MSAFLIDFLIDLIDCLIDCLIEKRRADLTDFLIDFLIDFLTDFWDEFWNEFWDEEKIAKMIVDEMFSKRFDSELDSRLERFFCDYRWINIATLVAKESKLHFAMNWNRKLQKANTVRDFWEKITHICNKFIISIIQNVYIIILLTWQWEIAKITFWWLMRSKCG